ncbi:DUF5327 family protein [Anaerobacillus sp. CMMVII]|uniref:YwdI family protein n=1 Tax=Anaerobacillus sp. CMMVII TaxID=2755588 RepID=UPI0021B6FF92|nr:YwdI family protein [Anaerobacillus sp. CMMVII]MCT8140043.1 DUF5327 family protein [Anaerobacillus sp. CMMVII]
MNIGTEVIINKLEEKVTSVKKAIHTQDNERLTEDLISIKAYCDLLLEARKDVRPAVVMETKITSSETKVVLKEKPDSESLFDF